MKDSLIQGGGIPYSLFPFSNFVFSILFLHSFISAQSDWTWRNPWPTGNDIGDMVWTGKMIVGVGGNGTVATSSDGLDWAVQYAGNSNGYRSLAWNGTRFVAVGTSIESSEDPANWTIQVPDAAAFDGMESFLLSSVIWTGSQFVAVGEGRDSTQLSTWRMLSFTSTDGIDWSKHDAGENSGLWDVAWSEELQLLVGVGYYETILTSPDGVEWTLRNQNREQYLPLRSVAWSGERFVAIGFEDGRIFSSEDGITWTRDFTQLQLWDINWTGSPDSGGFGFAALGGGFSVSPDGENWMTLNDSIDGGHFIWTGERLITSAFSTSPDGVTWTKHGGSVTQETLNDVIWVPGVGAVAVGESENILISPDGVNWTRRNYGTVYRKLLSVVWGPGVGFVAVGHDSENPINNQTTGIFFTSPDGIDWTTRAPGVTVAQSVVWTGNRFVAAGYGDTAYVSEDGSNWTKTNKGYPATIYGMAWTDDQIVAVGQAGAILTSPDGVEWAVQDSGVGDRVYYDVVWTGEQLVAVGAAGTNGLVVTSSDGITWTDRESGIEETLNSVTYSGNWLVVAGSNSTTSSSGNVYASSDDGITWHAYPTGTLRRLNSVTWAEDKFIVVGYDGNILTTPEDGSLFVQNPQGSFGREIFLRVGRKDLFYALPAGQATRLKSQEIRTMIYTLSGQRLQKERQLLSGFQGTLSIRHLPPGPYLLELMAGGKRYNRGFTVVR